MGKPLLLPVVKLQLLLGVPFTERWELLLGISQQHLGIKNEKQALQKPSFISHTLYGLSVRSDLGTGQI